MATAAEAARILARCCSVRPGWSGPGCAGRRLRRSGSQGRC